jgi:protein AATF/BFR2
MQKVIDEANKLPQGDAFGDFLAKTDDATQDLTQATKELREVIDDLMDIRKELFEQNGSIDFSQHDLNTRKRYLDDDDDVYLEKLWSDMSAINDV